MIMNKKKIILSVIAGVTASVMIAVLVLEMIQISKLRSRNAKLEKFIEKNFDVDIDEWNGKRVAFTEAELVDDISDAIDDALGIYINGNTIEEFVENLLAEVEGEFMEIHEIYDDTAVVEAYRSGDTSGLSEEDLYVLNTAKEVIAEIITADMTDYEKELAVYNWQMAYVNYDEDEFAAIPDDIENYDYKPYGVLKYHTAICVGNATTFKLFMDLLEIDCKIIHSTEDGEHAWNMVCLDDEWYHVDLTFDSGTGEAPGYDYFNVPDSFKEDDGYEWDREEFPEADSIKYTYIIQNSIEVESVSEVPTLVKNAIDNNEASLVIKSKNSLRNIEDVIDNIGERVGGDIWIYLSTEAEIEEYNIYVINIYNEESFFDEDISTGDENVDDIIDEIF